LGIYIIASALKILIDFIAISFITTYSRNVIFIVGRKT